MPTRRSPDDFSRTGQVFFDLIREYTDGTLANAGRMLRARVEGSDAIGGQFNQNPPNPPRSVRARIYTSGMDASTPEIALPIFYPMFPNVVAQQGEHVIVVFEDDQRTSGYWLGVVPSFAGDLNYSNPDFRVQTRRDSSYVFEQQPSVQSTVNLDAEYGGGTLSTEGRQEMVDRAESTTRNPFENKRVLLIGDSQVAGAFGQKLGEILRDENSAASFARVGRVGWGVYSWLDGRLRPRDQPQQSIEEVISQNTPDILIISLGGNDGSAGFARRANYAEKVQEFLGRCSRVQKILWSGPPTATGPGARNQPGRQIAAEKIHQVMGDRFVNVFGVTNTEVGRRRDGVHFVFGAPALTPWAQLVIRKGRDVF